MVSSTPSNIVTCQSAPVCSRISWIDTDDSLNDSSSDNEIEHPLQDTSGSRSEPASGARDPGPATTRKTLQFMPNSGPAECLRCMEGQLEPQAKSGKNWAALKSQDIFRWKLAVGDGRESQANLT